MSSNEPRKLTEAEKAQYPAYREKWDKIGLDCSPANFPAAELALIEAYKVLGFKPPQHFIRCQSPYQMAYARAVIAILHDGQVDPTKDTADSLMAEWEEFQKKPKANEAKINQVKASVRELVSECGYGQHDATSLAFYDFYRTVCGLTEETEKAVPLFDVAKNCGWFLAHENVCFMCERTKYVGFDEQGRLHNETGAAIEYPDGWGLYIVNGVQVPKKVVTREYAAKDIDAERNAEVRRIMLRFYGTDKYIEEVGAKPIHQDEFGTLYNVPQQDDEPLMVVKVVNSTPEPDGTFKDYWLRVDPQAYGGLKTARAAVASTWRKPDGTLLFENASDYAPSFES